MTTNQAKIEVFKLDNDWHPYPWRFTVTFDGIKHEFAGLPNQCATKRAASIRARYRAKWLENGTFEQHYTR